VYSPVSIYIAISMAYLGAQSNTQNEISKPFNFPLNYTDLNTSFSKLMNEILQNKQEERNYLLSNTLFLQEGFYFLPSFLDTIKSYYSGVFKEVDYTKKYIYKEISTMSKQNSK
jgi:serine protease inhibitor